MISSSSDSEIPAPWSDRGSIGTAGSFGSPVCTKPSSSKPGEVADPSCGFASEEGSYWRPGSSSGIFCCSGDTPCETEVWLASRLIRSRTASSDDGGFDPWLTLGWEGVAGGCDMGKPVQSVQQLERKNDSLRSIGYLQNSGEEFDAHRNKRQHRKENPQNFSKALADQNADHYPSPPPLERFDPEKTDDEKKVRDGLTGAEECGYHVGPNSTETLSSPVEHGMIFDNPVDEPSSCFSERRGNT
jgi:hypothetical protein